MNLINDIYNFIKYLSFIDVTFFAAIISLLILIVTLIYFIKINRDDVEVKENKDLNNIIENIKMEEPNNIVEDSNEEGELLDLESLTKKLQEEKDESRINFTEYEKDQEEKAIISYDELLQKHNKYALNYEKEEVLDDLVVKKVNLNNLINTEKLDEVKNVRAISYEKEEAFLKALKELNSLLN